MIITSATTVLTGVYASLLISGKESRKEEAGFHKNEVKND